jgi:hypothetical protein
MGGKLPFRVSLLEEIMSDHAVPSTYHRSSPDAMARAVRYVASWISAI